MSAIISLRPKFCRYIKETTNGRTMFVSGKIKIFKCIFIYMSLLLVFDFGLYIETWPGHLVVQEKGITRKKRCSFHFDYFDPSESSPNFCILWYLSIGTNWDPLQPISHLDHFEPTKTFFVWPNEDLFGQINMNQFGFTCTYLDKSRPT